MLCGLLCIQQCLYFFATLSLLFLHSVIHNFHIALKSWQGIQSDTNLLGFSDTFSKLLDLQSGRSTKDDRHLLKMPTHPE